MPVQRAHKGMACSPSMMECEIRRWQIAKAMASALPNRPGGVLMSQMDRVATAAAATPHGARRDSMVCGGKGSSASVIFDMSVGRDYLPFPRLPQTDFP